MIVEIVSNGEKYFFKAHYVGPEHFKFEVLEFSNLEQIKEFNDALGNAITLFELERKPMPENPSVFLNTTSHFSE